MEKNCMFNKKVVGIIIFIYLGLASIFYYAANERICYTEYSSSVEEHDGYLEELLDGTVIEQKIRLEMDYIHEIGISVATFMHTNTGNIIITLEDANGEKVAQKVVKANSIQDNSVERLSIREAIGKGIYTLRIVSDGGEKDASITIYRNSKMNYLGQGYKVNGLSREGTLQLTVSGGINRSLARWYWPAIIILGIILCVVLFWTRYFEQSGKTNRLLSILYNAKKYSFLVKQLVSRDFKTRYKRSVLGVCWSLLNPILTMAVQYIVFSTIFRSEIEFFPVYLLSGSVFFSFFTDAVGNGLTSIVGNASLITKVYVPKYIYPISKVLSTSINLVLSIIPLFIVALVTKTPITKAYFLLPYVMACLVLFCIGMSFLLSSAMVFFRDTQFLWSVVTVLWMYMTPLFYPDTIIPERFRLILDLNPIYHYVKFVRMIMINGMSPYLSEYVVCLGFSIVFMICGILVYKKTQSKFVLYI